MFETQKRVEKKETKVFERFFSFSICSLQPFLSLFFGVITYDMHPFC